MRVIRGIVVAIVVICLGCACQSAEPSVRDTQVQYLSIVCSVDRTLDDLGSYVDPYTNSLAQFRTAAANARDQMWGAAKSLDAPDSPWPSDIEGDIAILKSSYLSDAGMFDSLSKAPTWEAVTSIFYQNTDTTGRDAKRRIRFALDLPAVSNAACE